MSRRAGVELAPTRLRAVLVSSWRHAVQRTIELPWDPTRPRDGVRALRDALGAVEGVALAIGLGLLHVKKVELPPGDDDTRERMVALESERFFATGEPVIVALAPGGSVVFAADAAALDLWCAAFDEWAPVIRVDPAPVAAARTLGSGAAGQYAVDSGETERGTVVFTEGRVTSARRVPAVLAHEGGRPLPASGGVDGRFVAALGAVLGDDAGDAGTLATSERRAGFRARRLRRLLTAAVAAVAAVVFFVLAFDRARERELAALTAEASRLDAESRPALAAQQRAALTTIELAALRDVASKRPDAAAALAAISDALPADAVVLSARATGDEWQIEGTARSAAVLVPRLDQDGRFDNVRSLSATSRFRDANRTLETFSIALRVRPTT